MKKGGKERGKREEREMKERGKKEERERKREEKERKERERRERFYCLYYLLCYLKDEKEELERELSRLKEGGGEETRLEELMEVERELKQANKTIQQQVKRMNYKCHT